MADAKGKGKRPKKKKDRKVEAVGVAHIQSTFNNTIITLTDTKGEVVSWASGGKVGFKGSRKSTPFAAQLAAEKCAKEALDLGLRRVEVRVRSHSRASSPRASHTTRAGCCRTHAGPRAVLRAGDA